MNKAFAGKETVNQASLSCDLQRQRRPTLDDAMSAGRAFMKEQSTHINCDDWESAAAAWLTTNVPSSLPGESDDDFTKLVGALNDAFMFGAQQAVIDKAAWHGSQWGAMDIQLAATHRFEEGLPKRLHGQSKTAYEAFVDQAKKEFLRGLNKAVVVREIPEITSDDDAVEDLTCLAEVFGWLEELFLSISAVVNDHKILAGIKLVKIDALTSLGANVAINWQGTAESMARNFRGEISAPEIKADLAVTAQAFATSPRAKTVTKTTRETEAV